MTDKELLEYAAKAAELQIDKSAYNGGGVWNDGFDCMGNAVLDWHNGVTWNPLTDDGDALRLAVKCRISIEHPNPYDGGGFVTAYVRRAYYRYVLKEDLFFNETLGDDRDAATCRAIVRAAAEIGKAMP